MKNFLLFFIFALLISTLYIIIAIATSIRNEQKEYTYTGTVTQHLYEPPTSGYKSITDAKYWILMRENKNNKVIRVKVTIPTYYSLNDGDVTSFTIKNITMYRYGNTIDWNKNLYEE